MLIAAMLLAQAGVPAAPMEDEVTVVGRLMRSVRINYRTRKGEMRRCSVTRSSGEPIVDQLVCETARECVAAGQGAKAAMGACLAGRREEIRAKWRERRGASGT